MAAGSRTREKRGVAARACGQRGVATGATPTPTARQLGQRPLPPGWPSAPAGGREGRAEGVRAERRLDPGTDGVEVDADGRQRFSVEAAQRVGRLASPDGAQYFRLDAFGRDALVAQGCAGRLAGRGRGQQQVLAADVVVPERRASAWAWTTTWRAVSVKRSNIIASRSGARTCGARSAW